jgi:hypothetical protein
VKERCFILGINEPYHELTKPSGNTFSGEIYCTNTGQILTLRVYVVAALQIRHQIAYELEMGDYDLQ